MKTHRLWLRGVRRRDASEGPRPAQAPPRPQAERRGWTGGASDSGEAWREEKTGTARGGHARHFFTLLDFAALPRGSASARSRVKQPGGELGKDFFFELIGGPTYNFIKKNSYRSRVGNNITRQEAIVPGIETNYIMFIIEHDVICQCECVILR